MAVATATALMLGGLAASGVGSAVKAKKQATAAKQAAEQLVQGTKEATGYVQQGLGQLGQLYAPYINSGASARGTLARLTTPGPGATYASPGPPNAMPQAPPPNQAVPRMGYAGVQYTGGAPPMGPQGQMQGPPPGMMNRPRMPPPGMMGGGTFAQMAQQSGPPGMMGGGGRFQQQ
jgi:hypothetical protein